MKKIILVILYCMVNKLSAQVVLNGDFENNNADSCQLNLQNWQFDLLMSDCHAFGIVPGELDIMNGSIPQQCYWTLPQSGIWFVSLCGNLSLGVDALTLKISALLTLGNHYNISWWEQAAGYPNTRDTMLIGLSTNDSTAGQIIFKSLPICDSIWHLKSVNFTANVNSSYITFSNAGQLPGCNFLDNVVLTVGDGVEEIIKNPIGEITPNPTSGIININLAHSGVRTLHWELTNELGQVIQNSEIGAHGQASGVDLTSLPNGIYFYRMSIEDLTQTGKIIILR